MSYFEYKVVPAPSVTRWRQRRVDGMDKYASTIADLMTEMGLEGWDFIGAEALKERRRRFFVLICDVERTLMIFRRQAAVEPLEKAETSEASGPPPEPVKPRRVQRPELVAEVAAGARRIQVNVVKRPDAIEAGETSAAEPDADERNASETVADTTAGAEDRDTAQSVLAETQGESAMARAVTKAKTARRTKAVDTADREGAEPPSDVAAE